MPDKIQLGTSSNSSNKRQGEECDEIRRGESRDDTRSSRKQKRLGKTTFRSEACKERQM